MSHAQTYDFLCDCLALASREGAGLDQLRDRIERQEEWHRVFELASRHLLTPALCGALDEKGLLGLVPSRERDYLDAVLDLNRERNAAFLRELTRVVRLLNAVGVEPVLLKGIASLITGLYRDPGERVLSDIDILVPSETLPRCEEVLRGSGYDQDPPGLVDWAVQHHAPPLFHESEPVRLELHRHVVRRDLERILPTSEVQETSRRLVVDGVSVRVPAPTVRVLHNVVHSQLQDGAYRLRLVQLRQVYEFTRLCRALDGRIDWREIERRLDTFERRHSLQVYLLTAVRRFGLRMPVGLKVGRASRLAEWEVRQQMNWPRVGFFAVYARRLPKLPRRLVTPSWYPNKIRALRKAWQVRRKARTPRESARRW